MKIIFLPYKCQLKSIILINIISLAMLIFLTLVIDVANNSVQQKILIDDRELFVYNGDDNLSASGFTDIYIN